jgi:hypothetical protein
MKWYVEKHVVDEYIIQNDQPSKTGEKKTVFLYPYQAERPKKHKQVFKTSIEVPPPPSAYHVPANDGSDNFIWKLDTDKLLNKKIRLERNNAMKIPLEIIDQYRNEQEMIKEGIIIKGKYTKEQYKSALQYLQQLKDITENPMAKTKLPEVPVDLR